MAKRQSLWQPCHCRIGEANLFALLWSSRTRFLQTIDRIAQHHSSEICRPNAMPSFEFIPHRTSSWSGGGSNYFWTKGVGRWWKHLHSWPWQKNIVFTIEWQAPKPGCAENNIVNWNRSLLHLQKGIAIPFMQAPPEGFVKSLLKAKENSPRYKPELAKQGFWCGWYYGRSRFGWATDNRTVSCHNLPIIIQLKRWDARGNYCSQSLPKSVQQGESPHCLALAPLWWARFVVTEVWIRLVLGRHLRACPGSLRKWWVHDVRRSCHPTCLKMGCRACKYWKRGNTKFGQEPRNYISTTKRMKSMMKSQQRTQRYEEKVLENPLRNFAILYWNFPTAGSEQIEQAQRHPRREDGLEFRCVLGLSSNWQYAEIRSSPEFQIWCGPAWAIQWLGWKALIWSTTKIEKWRIVALINNGKAGATSIASKV